LVDRSYGGVGGVGLPLQTVHPGEGRNTVGVARRHLFGCHPGDVVRIALMEQAAMLGRGGRLA